MLQLLLFTCLTRVTAFPFHLSHLLHKLLSATIDFPFSRVTFFHLLVFPWFLPRPNSYPSSSLSLFFTLAAALSSLLAVASVYRRLRVQLLLPPFMLGLASTTFVLLNGIYIYFYLFLLFLIFLIFYLGSVNLLGPCVCFNENDLWCCFDIGIMCK